MKNVAVERGCHFFHHGLCWLLSPHLVVGKTPEIYQAAIDLGWKAATDALPCVWSLITRPRNFASRKLITASVQWTPVPSCCHHHRLCDSGPLTSGHTSFTIARYDAPVTIGSRCALSIHRILSIESLTSAPKTSPSSNRLPSRWKAHCFGIRCLLVRWNLRMKRRQRTVVL